MGRAVRPRMAVLPGRSHRLRSLRDSPSPPARLLASAGVCRNLDASSCPLGSRSRQPPGRLGRSEGASDARADAAAGAALAARLSRRCSPRARLVPERKAWRGGRWAAREPWRRAAVPQPRLRARRTASPGSSLEG